MFKLKKKKTTKLLDYQQFLKNTKFKLKTILNENPILYDNTHLGSRVIEFNTYSNIYLPFTLLKIHEISTIKQKYENTILFDYDLNYNILKHFNKTMFRYFPKPTNGSRERLKGRILNGNWNKTTIYISILGMVFFIKPMNLHKALNFNKKKMFRKLNRKKKKYWRRINSTRLINSYTFRYLNFKIKPAPPKKGYTKELSRVDYIKEIVKKKNKLNTRFKYRYRRHR